MAAPTQSLIHRGRAFLLALGVVVGSTLLPSASMGAFGQLALYDPVQVVGAEKSVTGVRLNLLLGVNQDVTGLDLGLAANRTVGDQVGLQLALYNEVSGSLTGVELGVLLNDVEGEMTGLQLAAAANYAASGAAAQIAPFINETEDLQGLQLALVNLAGEMQGLQLGVLNIADGMKGLQLGLLNFNEEGFLPFFPFFNFGF